MTADRLAADPLRQPSVRVPPTARGLLGRAAQSLAQATAQRVGMELPHVFPTIARHPRLFRWWLPFASTLLFRVDLPRAEVELVVLRTAWNCSSWYEWAQHVGLAQRAGLSVGDVLLVQEGWRAEGWTPRRQLLLRAVDELHIHRVVSDETWDALAEQLTEREQIELCFLVGHYEMLAMVLNSLGVEAEQSALDRLDRQALTATHELRGQLAKRRRRRNT
jgi:alkylhydroperoxidase family enzyme